MNKKFLSIVILFIILATASCGCGKSSSAVTKQESTIASPVSTEQTTTSEPSTPAPTTTTPAPTSEPVVTTPEPTPAVEVEWQTLICQWEDNSGYQFEATIKVSPWINQKNEDYLYTAWDEVGKGRTLPYFNPNERAYHNGKCSFYGATNLTDMYYCIGDITIKNVTSGWDIKAESPVSTEFCISPIQSAEERSASVKEGRTIGQVILTNKTTFDFIWSTFYPKLTSNTWGPVPFAFVHYEQKTPKYPDGEYISEITDTVFCAATNYHAKSNAVTIKLDVVEKDS